MILLAGKFKLNLIYWLPSFYVKKKLGINQMAMKITRVEDDHFMFAVMSLGTERGKDDMMFINDNSIQT